jgi:hypothetical protein
MSQLDNLWCMACRGAYDRQGRFAARPRCWNSLGTRFETHRSNCPGDDVWIYDYEVFFFKIFFFPPHFLTLISQGAKNRLYQTPNTEGNKKAKTDRSWSPDLQVVGRGGAPGFWGGHSVGSSVPVRMVTSQNCRAFSELFRFHTQLYLYFILTIWEFGHLSIIKSMLFKSHRACTSHANTPPSFPFPPSAALVPKGTFRAFPKGKRWRSQGVWGWHQKSSSDASDVDFPGLTYFHTKPWLKGHQLQLQAPDQNLEIRYPNVQWL